MGKIKKNRSRFKVTESKSMAWKGGETLSKGIQMRNIKVQSLLVQKTRLEFLKSRSNFKVEVMWSKFFVPTDRPYHMEYTCEIWKPYLFWLKSFGPGKSFSKVGQTSRLRSRGQKSLYRQKGLITRNIHEKYESPNPSCSKVMAQVKVFQK